MYQLGVYVIFWGKPNETRSITKVVSFIFFCMFLFLVCWRDAEWFQIARWRICRGLSTFFRHPIVPAIITTLSNRTAPAKSREFSTLALKLWKRNHSASLRPLWLVVRLINPNLKSPLNPIEFWAPRGLFSTAVNSSVEYWFLFYLFCFLLFGFYFKKKKDIFQIINCMLYSNRFPECSLGAIGQFGGGLRNGRLRMSNQRGL
jgi:hypothetical protein